MGRIQGAEEGSRAAVTGDGDKLMTTAEVCAYTRLSRMTVWRATEAGELRVIRMTKRANRFRRVDVDAWIERKASVH